MWITVLAFLADGIFATNRFFTFDTAMPQLNQVRPGPDVCRPEIVARRAVSFQPKSGRTSAPSMGRKQRDAKKERPAPRRASLSQIRPPQR
jgi:hypothetical protein